MGEPATLDPSALDRNEAEPLPTAVGGESPAAVAPSTVIAVLVVPESPAGRRGHDVPQTVDPSVSRAKFDRELAAFRRHEGAYRSRGWILESAEFPQVSLILAVPQIRPAAILFGVVVDFTNYDVEPPSVRLIEPFSRRSLLLNDLPTRLSRRVIREGNGQPVPAEPGAEVQLIVEQAELLQALGNSIPFLCIPGIREYHDHPAHTGDSWFLHRGTGAGTLDSILNVFHTYGVSPARGYQIIARQIPPNQVEMLASPQAFLWLSSGPA